MLAETTGLPESIFLMGRIERPAMRATLKRVSCSAESTAMFRLHVYRNRRKMKLFDEFRHGWQGTEQPSPLFGIGFAVCCLALGTFARWGFSLIRPDIFFTPNMPAVFFV